MVGVAVGAVETHSAEGVARNGSRHDGNLHLPHHAPRRAQSILDAPALSILENGVFQAAPGEDWGKLRMPGYRDPTLSVYLSLRRLPVCTAL